MSEFIFADQNDRTIPAEDAIFGISQRANAAKAAGREVINGTIGMLLGDDGKPMVLSSVASEIKTISAEEFAPYAPIGGTPGYRAAVKRAAFRSYTPKSEVRVVATPGGTGAIRTAVANYTNRGDRILTTDWHWGPYNKIADEQGRSVVSFGLFNENRGFNLEAFEEKIKELLSEQEDLLIIINTPAQNPTGYEVTLEEWDQIVAILSAIPKDKRATLLVDTAYIDFAGDEDRVRGFLPKLEELPGNVFPMLAFSLSKTFTMYGMRCGALIAMAPTEEIAEEFVRVCEFSCRATWSNSPRIGQSLIEKIFADEELLKEVTRERAEIGKVLHARGRAFEKAAEEAGLEILPYDSGFFVTVPCDDPKGLGLKLEEEGIFLVPFGKGLRVSVASVTEEQCRIVPAKILEAMKK